MSENITQKLRNWLDKTGYPLEMKVAKAFKERDMLSSMSSYYTDYETEKNREIDIVSRQYDNYEPFHASSAAIAEVEVLSTIECKSHQGTWVFFKNTKLSRYDFECSLLNNDAKKLFFKSKNEIKNNLFYKLLESSATGVTEAFSQKDTPYTATMGALKAAEAELILAFEREKKCHLDKEVEITTASCIFPIVITDAKLFEVSLSDENLWDFQEVQYTSVATRYPRGRSRGGAKGTVIYVFQESAINHLADALEDFHEILKVNLYKLPKYESSKFLKLEEEMLKEQEKPL